MSTRHLRLLRQGYVLVDEQDREVLRFNERLDGTVVEALAGVILHALWFTDIQPWEEWCGQSGE